MSGTCAPIFQFPPPRGGEQATPCAGPRRADFNSRPREGANRPRPARGRGEPISIPAPARGRTWQPLRACLTVIDFNSRPREGANLGAFTLLLPLSRFQFPPPRGGERKKSTGVNRWNVFQFPPPRGGERIVLAYVQRLYSFQFPPPRGGERQEKLNSPSQLPISIPAVDAPDVAKISIPAPARGRTSGSCGDSGVAGISIPAPARGRTHSVGGAVAVANFNSRPREGANIGGLDVLVSDLNFNSRPREGANWRKCTGTHGSRFQFPPPRGGERNFCCGC